MVISGPDSLGPVVFPTLSAAYVAVLRHVHAHHHERVGNVGHPCWECRDVSFRVSDPRQRLVLLRARRANVAFNIAETLWYLSGRADAEMIGYYAPRLMKLAGADGMLTGTAYGPPLFRPSGTDGRSQFDQVIDLIRQDPATKRAALIVMRPGEVADPGNPDVSCTLALHLMLRDGRLHLTTYMRGNDALIGLLGDTYAFTVIQEHAAALLGAEVGDYTHHAGSMHINLPDIPRALEIIDDAHRSPSPTCGPEPMTAASPGELGTVLRWEEQLRRNLRALTGAEAQTLPVHGFWRQALGVLEAYRQIRHTSTRVGETALALMGPAHRWLMASRWPNRIPPHEQPAGPRS
ncbi:thymidylate synthase [Catenuloplanes japonicus]|uniref:thymidylate synthase n=1 Tax=Catenuloplanes japonicus TaxID=33876 RepID=UPI0018DD5DEE|nr:thymidylate synthase [Catenuloplanes japonicus]